MENSAQKATASSDSGEPLPKDNYFMRTIIMNVVNFLSQRGFQNHHYQPLNNVESQSDTSESSSVNEKCREHIPRHGRQWISILVGFAVFTTLLTMALFASKKAPHWDQCGTTPAEARSRDCIFEVTLSLWVPKECYDRDLEEEYLRSEDLSYYRDMNLTDVVPLDEVRTGEQYGWFVSYQHHIRHCEFGLRKFHRAVISGGKIDGYLLSYNHTMHCLKMFTDPPEKMSKLPQRDVRMFPYCGKRGGYNVDKTKLLAWTD
ncbi:hypothetical protein R6Q59_010221 [Mikania micrantha]